MKEGIYTINVIKHVFYIINNGMHLSLEVGLF